MIRRILILVLVIGMSFDAGASFAAQRGGGRSRGGAGGERGGNRGEHRAPGGEWSQRSHGGRQTNAQASGFREQSGEGREGGRGAGRNNSTPGAGDHEAAAGATAKNRRNSSPSGADDAAAGAAAKNRKNSPATGADGAAAGAAAANRKNPQASGADGAAAGAAAANRKNPQATGAGGAAAGDAAANRNNPQATGAEGAAAGAAAANRRGPQYSGAQGAAAGAALADRNSPAFSGADGAAAGYASVRNSFTHPNIYGQQWYGDHPGAWAATGWAAGAAWAPTTWGAVAGFCGYGDTTPISYDYGNNVTAQDGNVLVDGQNVGTTEEFSQQAADLATTGTEAQPADTDKWLPLGVFAMVRNEQQHPQLIVQLAINQQGILRGNYTDELTDHTLPIHGAVDQKTQRAAWTVGDNQSTVMEAGLNDLTESAAPALIHKNGKTDHWVLVRLDQPPAADGDAPAESTPQ